MVPSSYQFNSYRWCPLYSSPYVLFRSATMHVWVTKLLGKAQSSRNTPHPPCIPQRLSEVLSDFQRTAEHQGEVLRSFGMFVGNFLLIWGKLTVSHILVLFPLPSSPPPLHLLLPLSLLCPPSPIVLACITVLPLILVSFSYNQLIIKI